MIITVLSHMDCLFDIIQLSSTIRMFEILVLAEWLDHFLTVYEIRAKIGINVNRFLMRWIIGYTSRYQRFNLKVDVLVKIENNEIYNKFADR